MGVEGNHPAVGLWGREGGATLANRGSARARPLSLLDDQHGATTSGRDVPHAVLEAPVLRSRFARNECLRYISAYIRIQELHAITINNNDYDTIIHDL